MAINSSIGIDRQFLSVRLLREVLDEMNVTYSKNLKKADLVKKVREARKEILSDNAGDSASRSSKSSGVGSARPKTVHAKMERI